MQIFQACRVLTIKYTINRKWLGSCIREGTSKKRVIRIFFPPPTNIFVHSLNFLLALQHFSAWWLNLNISLHRLVWPSSVASGGRVRFLAPCRSIRHCKHIFNYKALAPGRPWQSNIHAAAIFLRVLHLMPDGVGAHNARKQCGWWIQNVPAAMILKWVNGWADYHFTVWKHHEKTTILGH